MTAIVKNMPSPFDVKRIRADFPVLHQQVHDKDLVYMDNAATTQKPERVIEAVDHFYRSQNANVHRGVHALSEAATDAYEQSRETVRRFIHAASCQEIVFVRGTTEAINMVAQCYGGARLRAGDQIILTTMEHHANIVPWQMVCEKTGAVLKVIPVTDRGELDLQAYADLLSDKTRIVALTHVSNALGTVNPVKHITDLAHQAGAVVLLDGAQAVSHFPVDVQKLDCDFYAFSAHKVFGPTGIGVLYGKQNLLDAMPPYQGGGEMIRTVSFEKTTYNEIPYKFEAGTPHIAGALGLAAALKYLNRLDRTAMAQHEQNLIEYAHGRAGDFPGLRIIGEARQKTSVLSFVLSEIHSHDVSTILDQHGIAVRAGHHCAMPLMRRFNVPATARASFAMYNSIDEVDALFEGLKQARNLWA